MRCGTLRTAAVPFRTYKPLHVPDLQSQDLLHCYLGYGCTYSIDIHSLYDIDTYVWLTIMQYMYMNVYTFKHRCAVFPVNVPPLYASLWATRLRYV